MHPFLRIVALALFLAWPRHTAGAPTPARTAAVVRPIASDAAWSEAWPRLGERVRAKRTLVVQVLVPMCSHEQINCGGSWAGHPGGLRTNVYWGALYGARRFFDRSDSGWERVDVAKRASPVLEQAVFRRRASGAAWGVDGTIEVLVVLQAVHGSLIQYAVDELWHVALLGGEVAFQDGGRLRREPVTVVGYAGHNRLMDGKSLPPKPANVRPIPSFVLACMSDKHFGRPLRKAGSWTLLTTRSYMAPEGYVIDAVAKTIAVNGSPDAIRDAAVNATAKWQRISRASANTVFEASAVRGGS